MSAQAFFSSSTLQLMNSTMSGWSAFRMTIFAARRVLPPDLITPANASYPFMNDTGPDAVPPPASSSLDDRIGDRLVPARSEEHTSELQSRVDLVCRRRLEKKKTSGFKREREIQRSLPAELHDHADRRLGCCFVLIDGEDIF